ncbi:MAG: sugar ABC transporter ATP-binding protein [Chloroflexi bacterium]|nr:sugar ABC transporter ATP-binding protein [Chloroflexota bacterium]
MSTLPLLQVQAIDKSFPGVHALDHVDFDLCAGEVHVLLGENGAGKSTFMKIISGALQKDSGHILLRGKEVEIADPQHACALGIGMVYQELSLIPTLTVAENIFVGRLPRRGRLRTIAWSEVYSHSKMLLDDLGVNINVKARVAELSMAERQLTEIAKVLTLNAQILLLDEPTSSLSEEERVRLFDIIRRLQKRGVGVIYVSHRLGEVPQIGQRVTVLRDGKRIGSLPVSQAKEDTLISMLVGRELTEQFPKVEVTRGVEILRVQNLSVKGTLGNLSLNLHAGEILGIFGLVGAGRTDLVRAIFGLHKLASGEISVNGRKTTITCPRDAVQAGLGYLTEDRKDGLVQLMPIPANTPLASLARISRWGVLSHATEEREARHLVDELKIHAPRLRQRVEYLSGGNQQKVALAKWLCSRSKVLIFDEPTRGIDVGAKVEVYRLMNELAGQGIGILMISSELPEVMAMADRILVMARGAITAEYERGRVSPEDIMRRAAGR